MRLRARIDENQPAIVEALRLAGATVQPLHQVGKGCPDLLVGFRQATEIFEIKNPLKPRGGQQLTEDQVIWHREWKGKAPVIVCTERDALAAIGALEKTTNTCSAMTYRGKPCMTRAAYPMDAPTLCAQHWRLL